MLEDNMKLAVIGPCKLDTLKFINPDYKKIISDIAKIVAEQKFQVYLTPDFDSASELFAKEFLNAGGKNLFEVLPLEDKLGYSWINSELGKHVNCGVWGNQPEKLNEETKAILCLGYGASVLAEIAYSKLLNPKPVYIIKELVSMKLPKELERSLDLRYVSCKMIKRELASLS